MTERDYTSVSATGILSVVTDDAPEIDRPSVSATGILSVGTGYPDETFVENGILTVVEGGPSWPDENSTGPRIAMLRVPEDVSSGTGWTWDADDFFINATGATINLSGLDISGAIICGGAVETLTVTDCQVDISDLSVNHFYGIIADGSSSVVNITYTRVIGGGAAKDGDAGIVARGTIEYCDVSGFENFIVTLDGAFTIRHNYLHDLGNNGAEPHFDGVEIKSGAEGGLLEGNYIGGRDTSAIIIKADFSLDIDDITITGNYLAVEGSMQWTINTGSTANTVTNVTITGNYIEPGEGNGGTGYYSIEPGLGITLTGNFDALTGDAIPDYP